jgi:tetratricopeptide (TPR) repeat protein
MPRLQFASRFALPALLLSSACLFAQTDAVPPISDGSTVMTTPSQLRRIEPPSATATEQQLEQTADILRAEKFYADAVDYYEAALRKSSSRAVLYNKEGIAELMSVHLREAKHDFEHAIKEDKQYPEATNNLGVLYYNLHNYGKAIKYYSKALALNPNSASFHSNLGTAYFSKKEYELASHEYAAALSLDPEIFDRHSQTGISAQVASLEDRARYSYILARMFAARGDADRCLLYLKKAMEEGYKVAVNFQKDREFSGFRKDPRFITLLQHGPEPLPN